MKLRWPSLSIRATVLAAIVVGMVLAEVGITAPMALLRRRMTALAQGETFDIVLNMEVVEHVADDDGALAELARVHRPEFGVVTTTPFGDIMKNSSNH